MRGVVDGSMAARTYVYVWYIESSAQRPAEGSPPPPFFSPFFFFVAVATCGWWMSAQRATLR